jgi:hypothetical protein
MPNVKTYINRIEGWGEYDIPWEIEFYGCQPNPRYIVMSVYTSIEDFTGVVYTIREDLFSKLWKAYWEVDRCD